MQALPPCFQNFITSGSVAECSAEPSVSGLYFTDIAGVSGIMLANLADTENKTIAALCNRLLTRAVVRFRELLSAALVRVGIALREGYEAQKAACKFTSSTVPMAAAKRGILIKKPAKGLPAYVAFFINSLTVKAATSGAATVEIIDGEGTVLWAKTIQAQANISQTLQVQQEFYAEEVYVVWDNTALDVYGTSCTTPCGGCNCSKKCGCSKTITERYSITGWDGSQTSTEQYGIIMDGGAQCSFNLFMCAYAAQFSTAILSLCEAEFWDALMKTDRLNNSTVYCDKSELEGYMAKAKNSAAKRIGEQLSVVLPSIKENIAYCVTCNTTRGVYLASMA